MFIRRLLFASLFLILAGELHAQIEVDLNMKRRLYVLYEPIIANVTVVNQTGKDITLVDAGSNNWFSFQITTDAGQVVPPVGGVYHLEPLTIRAGETVKRTVNLTELYSIRNFGLHRIRASIYYDAMGRYFSSGYANIELTEGRTFWEKTVGVPEGLEGAGGLRKVTLLTFRQPLHNVLYARITDPDEGIVFCMYELGRVLQSDTPQAMLDADNNLHILQLVGPKTYLYSSIGINGEWRGNKNYTTTRYRPRLKQTTAGAVGVAGGQMEIPPDPAEPAGPQLSDRPPGMPTE